MAITTCYADIFHEIKNSVTLISSYLQLIGKKHPELTRYDYWENSLTETNRLCTIVSELSQLKFGEDLHLEPTNIQDFLTGCCSRFLCSPEDEKISWQLSLSEQPLVISADARQLRHAVINLLKNSCEAMNHCGRILIAAAQKEKLAVIRITDFGCGIQPALIPCIFEPFTTTKEDGSGLGLHIARQIIAAHHGTITVDSAEGKGCTFTISLPCLCENASSGTEALPEAAR